MRDKILGFAAIWIETGKPVKTTRFAHNTAKIYSSCGTAVGAIKNSVWADHYRQGKIRIIPVTIYDGK